MNAPEVVTDGRFDHLVNNAACGLPVQEVAISNTTKKLLGIPLKDEKKKAFQLLSKVFPTYKCIDI